MGVRWCRSVNRLPIVWDDKYSPEFPESHRFPMKKFRLLKDWVDLHVPATQLFSPKPCPVDVLVETHDPGYVRGFELGTLDPKVIREIGLPWSEGLRDRTILALGGTIRTCELAKAHGLATWLVAPITRTVIGGRDSVSTTISRSRRDISSIRDSLRESWFSIATYIRETGLHRYWRMIRIFSPVLSTLRRTSRLGRSIVTWM